tara:strand:- start:16 stop:285 length:270 start_codon:yes stop_codon:yes gene_type:complete
MEKRLQEIGVSSNYVRGDEGRLYDFVIVVGWGWRPEEEEAIRHRYVVLEMTGVVKVWSVSISYEHEIVLSVYFSNQLENIRDSCYWSCD